MGTRLTEERKHTARQITGGTLSFYEFLAFCIDRPDRVPRLTDIGRMHPIVGGSMALWATGHLLKPSLTELWVRAQARRVALLRRV